MKSTTVLKVLLIVLASNATNPAGAAAADTNSPPAQTITLHPPPRMLQIATHDAGLRTIPMAEAMAQIATPCPDDVEAAISCFETNEMYAYLMVPDDLSGAANRSNLLVIARFLGEIRSRRIPDYKKLQVGMDSSLHLPITDPEAKNAYQERLAARELQSATFSLQQNLEMKDVSLTRRLLEACSRLQKSDPASVELLRQVADAAHLTADERKKLGLAAGPTGP